MRPLVVAAGGGGDAIAGVALAGSLGLAEPQVVMTFSWDRLMIDPLPGPRRVDDFTGLHRPAPHVVEIVGTTAPVPPAGSSLPRLAAELPARLVLLDPSGGAGDLTEQIGSTAAFFGLDSIALVDVGGDVLTDGRDAGLRSPLADQLALAACVRTGIPTMLLVTGAGLDGELPVDVVADRLARLHARRLPPLDQQAVERVRPVFTWHPSEASGLLTAAATGLRGIVEVRDAGDQVVLTDTTTAVSEVDGVDAIAVTPAARLGDSTSLDDAARIVREVTGVSEIEYEIRKATRANRHRTQPVTETDLSTVDRHAADAQARGADFISMRRLAELLGATTLATYTQMCSLLAARRPDNCGPSVYRAAAGSSSLQ